MGVISAQWPAFLVLGAVVGVISGMLGIGGAILVIPSLVFLFGFPQQRAVGTSLAMLLPPIGFFALMRYWPGNVDVKAAALMALGFAVGGYFGGWIANSQWMNEKALRILFAFFLLYVAGNMLFRSENRVQAAMKTMVVMVGYAAMYLAARLFGRKMERRLDLPAAYEKRLKAPLAPDYEI